jgi:MYXO-CTERM domain-containing protein
MFPDQTGDSCLQDGPIYANVGVGHEAMINATLAVTKPNNPCTTPIKPAFDQVSKDPQYTAQYDGTGPRSFVLFISDGQQTCGGNDAQIAGSVTMLFGKGYPSYIVGFGGQTDPVALTMYSTAGGVPRKPALSDGGTQNYFQADDEAALDDALDQIGGAVLGAAEFVTCPGIPCPDGRCFQPGVSCVMGTCVAPAPDGGGSGALDGGGNGGTGGTGAGGCGCRIGGAGTSGCALLLALALGFAWQLRRRLRSRP